VRSDVDLGVNAAKLSALGNAEEVYRLPTGMGRIALSPDGRYLLYTTCDLCDRGSPYRPMVLDLQTLEAAEGSDVVLFGIG